MRKAIALAAGLLVLALANYGIAARERLLREGQVVLLELVPVDPRSLMQGDYMRLDYVVAQEAFPWPGDRPVRADGHIVVAVDANRIGRFRRRADGRPLAPGEVALRYRVRSAEPYFATNAFFFQEGQAGAYGLARYGEFRVGADGEMILTGLRGSRLERLGSAR
jgi:uncharacterized membrane-anchored protein